MKPSQCLRMLSSPKNDLPHFNSMANIRKCALDCKAFLSSVLCRRSTNSRASSLCLGSRRNSQIHSRTYTPIMSLCLPLAPLHVCNSSMPAPRARTCKATRAVLASGLTPSKCQGMWRLKRAKRAGGCRVLRLFRWMLQTRLEKPRSRSSTSA